MKKILYLLLLLATIFSTQVHASKHNYISRDFAHFLDAAYIAQATYQSEQEMAAVLNKQGYQLKQFEQIEGFSVGYALAVNDAEKKQIVAVRGTSNIKNAVVDAAFVLVEDKISGIDIHQGFLLSARDIYQQILPHINPDYTIDTVGHSLGGAAALILAMMFDAQDYKVGEVITFGQPKVTNISGSRKFKHLDITRLVAPKDIVPLVPPIDPTDLMNFSIFWHQGAEIVLSDGSTFSVLTGVNSMMRATSFLNDIPSEQHLSHHFMSTYIDSIKTKLEVPQEIKYENDFKLSDWFGTSPK